MTDSNPRVSVIVPVYNVERYLDQALASVEAQTLDDIEIICVNDGSTDGSPAILEEHARRDERVRVIHKENGGYGSACNLGIESACGSWIAIVEPDDWIEPAMLADMLEFASSFDEPIDIVKTPYWRVIDPDTADEQTINCSYKGRIRPRTQPFVFEGSEVVHLIIHHPSIWSALYRRSFIDDFGIRFHEIPGAGWADNPFLIDTLCQARSIAYLDRAYYHYREETPEHFEATMLRDPFMPIDRWSDMVDSLDRLGVTDEAIRRALARRAFTYLDCIGSAVDLHRPDIQQRIMDMYSRMNDEHVITDIHIPPYWKSEYARQSGLPRQSFSKVPYATHLLRTGIYNLANVGPAFTMRSLRGFLSNDSEGSTETKIEDGPLISVIIPVYNAQRYLDECLGSLAAQTYNRYEAICVDDGSTDSSRAILKAYAAADERIRLIEKENGGPSSARNAGIAAARGEYLVFLDCDDELEAHALARLVAVLGEGADSSQSSIDIIVFGWSCFGGTPDHWVASRGNIGDAWYPNFTSDLIFDEPTQPFLRVAVRRSLLAEHGISFDESLYLGEDAAFLFSLYPHAHGVRLLSDKLYRYRLPHDGSIMQSARDNRIEECLEGINTVISVFGCWSRDGLLQRYGSELVEWSIKYSLYTILRLEEPARSELFALLREVWEAHGVGTRDLPDHAKRLVEHPSSKSLLAYRLAEYGPGDLALTVLDRLRG